MSNSDFLKTMVWFGIKLHITFLITFVSWQIKLFEAIHTSIIFFFAFLIATLLVDFMLMRFMPQKYRPPKKATTRTTFEEQLNTTTASDVIIAIVVGVGIALSLGIYIFMLR